MPSDAPSPTSTCPRKLGLIVNPIAGMGGAVALRGTDGESRDEAARRGAVAQATPRTVQALARIEMPDGARLYAAGGAMGEWAARHRGLDTTRVSAVGRVTTRDDTLRAAAALRQEGVELILFAGGDGTARDIVQVVGRDIPVLGIPAGVKMHSAVFATSPEAAGGVATAVLRAAPGRATLCDAEVVDVDEALLRQGVISTRLHGVARVPVQRRLIQHAKIGSRSADAALQAACEVVARNLEPGIVHLIGPGTTTRRVMRALALEGTLLGIDAVCDGALLGTDLAAAAIAALIAERPVRIIIGVVGGQGFLFGRGNQQIAAPTIHRAGRDGITILADFDKIAALSDGALFVDTGDPAVDAMLAGYVRVRTSPEQSLLCKVLC